MRVASTTPRRGPDAAVLALPVIAQLLLVGFLAVGGYRHYSRR